MYKKHKLRCVGALSFALAAFSPSASFTTDLKGLNVTVEQYDPVSDFGKNGNLMVSTMDVCDQDYLLKGTGCVSGELSELKIDKDKYSPGTDTSQLISLVDDLDTHEIYLYVFRNRLDLKLDTVSMSNSIVKKASVDNAVITFEENFKNFKIEPVSISQNGYFIKYRVVNPEFNLNTDSSLNFERRYMVRQLYNSSDALKSDIMNYVYDGFNEYFITRDNKLTKNKVDVLNITDKYISFDVVFEHNNEFMFSGAQVNTFAFFNTELDEYFESMDANLIGAVVDFDKVGYENVFIQGPQDYANWSKLVSTPMSLALKTYGLKNVETSALNVKRKITETQACPGLFGSSDLERGKLTSYNLIETDTEHVRVVIEPELKSQASGQWFQWNKKLEWNNMGKIVDNKHIFTNKFLLENQSKYKWYLNFDTYSTFCARYYSHLDNGAWVDSMSFNKFYDIKNTDISSLKFKYADSSIREFITVDVLKDSEGYTDFLDDKLNSNNQLIIFLVIIGIIVIATVLLLIFVPSLIPLLIKTCIKILLVIIKVVLWLPYLILIAPFQAIVAKKNNESFKLWNPFKFK